MSERHFFITLMIIVAMAVVISIGMDATMKDKPIDLLSTEGGQQSQETDILKNIGSVRLKILSDNKGCSVRTRLKDLHKSKVCEQPANIK